MIDWSVSNTFNWISSVELSKISFKNLIIFSESLLLIKLYITNFFKIPIDCKYNFTCFPSTIVIIGFIKISIETDNSLLNFFSSFSKFFNFNIAFNEISIISLIVLYFFLHSFPNFL